jgi:hypothetical protein
VWLSSFGDLVNSGGKMRRVSNTICFLFLFVLIASVSGCAGVQKDPGANATLGVASTSTPRPSLTISPSKTPTLASTITATVTPTPTPDPYRNWGKFPRTLDAEDIEKNGLILEFNPIDNPEGFSEEIIKIDNGPAMREGLGFVKPSKDVPSGYDPVLKRRGIRGEIIVPFQVMFFKYEGEFFPFIVTEQNGNDNEVVLIYDNRYEEIVKENKKGNKVTLYILEEMNEKLIVDYQDWGSFSKYMADLIRETGLAVSSIVPMD